MIYQNIPAGVSYITIFLQANSNSIKQSFGIAGIKISITTIIGGTITYVNNIAGTPTTVLGQVLTITAVSLSNNKIYQGDDNQVIYEAKYMSNVNDDFDYFGM